MSSVSLDEHVHTVRCAEAGCAHLYGAPVVKRPRWLAPVAAGAMASVFAVGVAVGVVVDRDEQRVVAQPPRPGMVLVHESQLATVPAPDFRGLTVAEVMRVATEARIGLELGAAPTAGREGYVESDVVVSQSVPPGAPIRLLRGRIAVEVAPPAPR